MLPLAGPCVLLRLALFAHLLNLRNLLDSSLGIKPRRYSITGGLPGVAVPPPPPDGVGAAATQVGTPPSDPGWLAVTFGACDAAWTSAAPPPGVVLRLLSVALLNGSAVRMMSLYVGGPLITLPAVLL